MLMVKAVAGGFGNPLLLGFILGTAGLLLLRGSRRRTGASIIAVGATMAYLASTSLVGNALLVPLEGEYPPLEPTQATDVLNIVVLGSGFDPRDHIPVTGALEADGLARIVEGVRLARARPDARLLLSGGGGPGFTPSALGYAELAVDLGIPRSALIVMDHALDTAQEAREVVTLLGQAPFILVTSAYHMPRAMRLMRRAGANPMPAPTGQISHAKLDADLYGLIPGSRGLRKTEAALHEYLGLAAVGLRID